MTSTTTRSLVLEPHAGRMVKHFANAARFKVTSEDTGGKYAVIEFDLAPGAAGPPLHRHDGTDEMHYVLSGKVGYQVAGRRVELGPGGFAYIERGTAHTMFNPTDEPARILIQLLPADFERFYFDVAELAGASEGEPDPAAMARMLARHDLTIEAPDAG